MTTNVHEFDTKLRNIFRPLKTYTNTEKKDEFNKLILRLNDIYAKQSVKLIIEDLEEKIDNKNYQKENEIDASDILIDILHKKHNDILPLIEEQLRDIIIFGRCPSGRTTRLLQIWLCLS